MSRLDEPVDRASVHESATLTVAAHDDGRSCQSCTSDGCPQDQWAREMLAGRAATLQDSEPA